MATKKKLVEAKDLEPRGEPQFVGSPVFNFGDKVYLDGYGDLDWIVGIKWTKGTKLNGWTGSWVYSLYNQRDGYQASRLKKERS